MVPHATGTLFVPSQRKGKAKLVVNSHLIHVEADFGNGLVTGLSIYHQAIGKDLAHLDATKTKKKWNQNFRASSGSGSSGDTLEHLASIFLTFGLLGLGLWYRSFPTPRGPGYLFTANKAIQAHDVTFEAFSLLPPHFQLYTGCL